jgi:hypothetical protein
MMPPKAHWRSLKNDSRSIRASNTQPGGDILLFLNHRSVFKAAFAITLCMTSIHVSALTFPIDLKREMKDIKVIAAFRTIEVGSTVVLTLSNLDQREASCKATFDPKVEQRKTKKRQIEPGDSTSIHYSPGRKVNRLSIHVTCKPA